MTGVCLGGHVGPAQQEQRLRLQPGVLRCAAWLAAGDPRQLLGRLRPDRHQGIHLLQGGCALLRHAARAALGQWGTQPPWPHMQPAGAAVHLDCSSRGTAAASSTRAVFQKPLTPETKACCAHRPACPV